MVYPGKPLVLTKKTINNKLEDNMAAYVSCNKEEKFQINTPEDFKNAWENHCGMDDVDFSPDLLATIYTPEKFEVPGSGKNYLYPKGFYYAWAFSSTNLALFLELNKCYGATDPTKVTVGIAEIAGFPNLGCYSVQKDDKVSIECYPGGRLAVYTLPDSGQGGEESQVLVPTVQTWLRILDDLGCSVPLATSIELTRLYSNLGSQLDVVDLYSELSGLSREILTTQGYAPSDPYKDDAWESYNITTELQKNYKRVIEALGKSPYDPGSDSAEVGAATRLCFKKLKYVLDGLKVEPKIDSHLMVMAVRAALAQAQDASALCTLAGVGYNTYPNPFVCKPISEQTIGKRYTGREFILLNRTLEECQEYVSIELKAKSKVRPYLENGWC
jgi:hypothetical protein